MIHAEPVVFALFVTGPDFDAIRKFRQEGADILLRCAGVLPAASERDSVSPRE